jgi:chemotaxis protein CheD
MSTVVEINIAELFVGDGSYVISTHGVGSCVVVVLYDRLRRVGGMAHAILPRVGDADVIVPEKNSDGKRFAKYADLAVDTLVRDVEALGGSREHLVAKLVGGAHMFALLEGESSGVGRENTESARERLLYYGIPVETEVIGGSVGRNVRFDCATGIVEILTKV